MLLMIPNMVIAMITTPLGQSSIELATKRTNRIFLAYIVLLVVTALLVALFTWLTWDSGNKLQDAIRSDANARIEEAKRGVAKLENDNVVLRKDLETETGKVAGLQRDASDAKAAQLRVETELAVQQGKTAKAEIALLELLKSMEPRRLTGVQKEVLTKLLKEHPDSVAIVSTIMDGEGSDFADDFESALHAATWQTMRIKNHISIKTGILIGCVAGTVLPGAKRLADALHAAGVRYEDATFSSDDHSTSPWFQSGVIYLVIERKPELTRRD